MDDGNCVCARRDIGKGHIGRLAGRDQFLNRAAVFCAIGECFRIFGQANHQLTFGAAQPANAQADISLRRYCRDQHARAQIGSQNGQGQYRCRKFCPKTESITHNCLYICHDVFGGALLLSANVLTLR